MATKKPQPKISKDGGSAKPKAPAKEQKAKPPAEARNTKPAEPATELSQPAVSMLLDEPDEAESAAFPIVGIGASAGGLEAFTELLNNLPSDTGMGFVFIQHLDPKHVSLLTELLQRHTSMPVQDATNGVKVEPNHLYIIPRNTHMSLVRGALTLSPRVGTPTAHMPIDPFLRSLAADQKSKAIGVILSGNASDGTLGMMAIKAAGGITFAQTSDSAKFDSMPRSAIAAGCIDFVLTPKEIAQELARLRQHPYIAPARSPAEEEPSPRTAEAIHRILGLLRNATNVDFTYYKPTTLRRRILRRMALQRVDNLDRYFAKLRADSAELQSLYEDILINVTEFFRDPEVFEILKETVFPKIAPEKDNAGPIRIWVPGCSNGEEVYSIAMVLLEYLGDRGNEVTIQIFGTDISDRALDKARSGIYAPGLVENISQERIRRFFTKVDSNYAISKRIREMCVFARQNLIKAPPFSKIDLISCRNVLIYLGPILQKRLIPIFHYSLKPNGFLLLGTSETIGNTELFALVDKKNKIYARLPGVERLPLEITAESVPAQAAETRRPKPAWSELELAREADRIVLGKYAPAGVVVDNDFNILQFRGKTSPYLEPPSGAATLNVLAMAREGLVGELRSALHRASRENAAVRRDSVRVRRDAGFGPVDFEVIPFKKDAAREGHYLILFGETHAEEAPKGKKAAKKRAPQAVERENNELRQELAATKEYLQSVIEQHETSNEELRSANEEIQSSNEELQSTNEELETAKEELQSTNEELNTVNEELQIRNLQLAQAGNDLINLLNNVSIPIIMVANDLRIRRFTPVSQRLLNMIPTDVGRPISDINMNLDIPKLDRLLLEVMETLTPMTMNVKDLNGRPYSLRIRPYRTEDNKIDGAVVVLVDLDNARNVADSLQALQTDTHPGETLGLPREALQNFTAGLMVAQERERRNIALELHDDVTQRLALLELSLASLERMPPAPEEFKHHLKTFQEQIAALSQRMQQIAHQLHPATLEHLGLIPALESYIHGINTQQKEVEITFQHENVPANLDQDTALCLYRIVQEALHNVIKHSCAKSAQVTLKGTEEKGLKLSILDTGTGFELNDGKRKGGLGLRSMQERVQALGGTFQLDSQPGKGTEVKVSLPATPERTAV